MIDQIARIIDNYSPLSGADTPWDNVGVLIRGINTNSKILITIDLTIDVLNEAVRKNIQNIISYHPVIFHGIKKIGEKEEVIRQCIMNNISVFCPHTSLDRKMNEYIISLFNKGNPVEFEKLVAKSHNYIKIEEAIAMLKDICNLKYLRVVLGANHKKDSVPEYISVGVGSSFKNINFKNHLIVTGEMSHHSLLEAKYENCTVILLEHSNSERIFLKVIAELFKEFEVSISEEDKDPVEII